MRSLIYVLPALLAALSCGVWAWQSASPDVVRIPVLLFCAMVLALAVRAARHPPHGQLVWDGRCWRWDTSAGTCLGSVHARFDGRQCLLLEFRPLQGRALWLWLEHGMAPLAWDDLRRAVYAVSADAAALPVASGEPS